VRNPNKVGVSLTGFKVEVLLNGFAIYE